MSTLADRLRGVLGHGEVRPAASFDAAITAAPSAGSAPAATADVLEGAWRESHGERFLVVDCRFAPGHRHGRVAVADGAPGPCGTWPSLGLLGGGARSGQALFVDLETTGIAGGAGTYAFLVGCGWFESGAFRVRQFFLSSFSAERALLHALGELAETAGSVVTYNGKSFDLPLLETRCVIHRMATPFARLPHVDMLHPARRLWRRDDESDANERVTAWSDRGNASSCKLTVLEQTQCGHVREGDVPGFEIPARYFHYVRTGDARPLVGVFEHNRLDLLSLALLTAQAAQLLDDGPVAARSAREALAMGKLYERAGMSREARDAYARAADVATARLPGTPETRADALRSYAVLSRRERRYGDAAAAWQRLLALPSCPPQVMREASEALAVHFEHRARDPRSARTLAVQSLQFGGSVSRTHALQHRLARLDRKLAEAALF